MNHFADILYFATPLARFAADGPAGRRVVCELRCSVQIPERDLGLHKIGAMWSMVGAGSAPFRPAPHRDVYCERPVAGGRETCNLCTRTHRYYY
eukprot:9493724-Pyramimonas_sp.AAC.1